MASITRYDVADGDFCAVMNSSTHGEYVTYNDYESLAEDYQKLCGMIRNLYLETP